MPNTVPVLVPRPKEQEQMENLQFFPWGPSTTAWRQQMGKHHFIQASFFALQQPQPQLRCCWLHYQANPILPVHIFWEDTCLPLSRAVFLPYPPTRVALDCREICPDSISGFLNCLKDHILDSIYRVSSESKAYNSSLEWTGTKYIFGG